MIARGFTLLELMIAMALLALLSSLLYGSLSMSAASWNRGEARAEQSADMRLAFQFLRQSLTAQHPLRMHKVVEQPLYFQGAHDSLAYAAVIPGRAGGGIYYFRLALADSDNGKSLVLSRVIPDPTALELPSFDHADFSLLARDVAELRVSYFGRDPNADVSMAPTWRDKWDDKFVLPLMIRIDVVPKSGAPWPSLLVEPRLAPEVGCRAWDMNRNRCVAV
jgi:general secretion pathway protein J